MPYKCQPRYQALSIITLSYLKYPLKDSFIKLVLEILVKAGIGQGIYNPVLVFSQNLTLKDSTPKK